MKTNIDNMIGGGKPMINNLKGINLFPKDSQIEEYLNPIYGFLWVETNGVENYYNFGDPDNKLTKFIQQVYQRIPGTVQPTYDIFKHVSTRELGKFLAYRYLDILNLHKDHEIAIIPIRQCIKRITKMKTINSHNICNNEIMILNEFIKKINIKYNMTLQIINLDDDNELIKNKMDSLLGYVNTFKTDIKPVNRIIKERISDKTFGWKENIMSIDMFHVILSIVWWNASSKHGIMEFYQGLNEILPIELQVIIPHDFVTDLFTKSDFKQSNTSDFYLALAYNYKLKHSEIVSHGQEFTYITSPCVVDFSDCGESTFRNFVKILIYNNDRYDMDILTLLGADEKVIEFFTVFNNEYLQSTIDKMDIFNERLNARDAWGKLVSNIPDVAYGMKCELSDKTFFHYEIKSGNSLVNDPYGDPIPNILCLFRKLFSNITEWDDILI